MKLKIYVFINFLILSNCNAFDFDSVTALVNKYKYTSNRPKSCPLESKKNSDILAKSETIKDIFKSNCFQGDEKKMTEILTSLTDVQEELKKKNILSNPTLAPINTNPISTANVLNGAKLSGLFSNISTVIKKHQCNLEDGRLLESVADIINDSTQFALVSGTSLGVMIAGGGFVVSSALKLIDLLLKQKFDFENNTSRQTFIKLNCSFYDIRRDMEGMGLIEIETNESKYDLKKVLELKEALKLGMKEIDQELLDQKVILEKIDENYFIEKYGNVLEQKKFFLKIKNYLINGINDSNTFQDETQKLLIVAKIAEDYKFIKLNLEKYSTFPISTMPMLENQFQQELDKYDPTNFKNFNDLLSMSATDFKNIYKPKLIFYVSRILNDINAKELEISQNNEEIKKNKITEMNRVKNLFLEKNEELKKLEDLLLN